MTKERIVPKTECRTNDRFISPSSDSSDSFEEMKPSVGNPVITTTREKIKAIAKYHEDQAGHIYEQLGIKVSKNDEAPVKKEIIEITDLAGTSGGENQEKTVAEGSVKRKRQLTIMDAFRSSTSTPKRARKEQISEQPEVDSKVDIDKTRTKGQHSTTKTPKGPSSVTRQIAVKQETNVDAQATPQSRRRTKQINASSENRDTKPFNKIISSPSMDEGKIPDKEPHNQTQSSSSVSQQEEQKISKDIQNSTSTSGLSERVTVLFGVLKILRTSWQEKEMNCAKKWLEIANNDPEMTEDDFAAIGASLGSCDYPDDILNAHDAVLRRALAHHMRTRLATTTATTIQIKKE